VLVRSPFYIVASFLPGLTELLSLVPGLLVELPAPLLPPSPPVLAFKLRNSIGDTTFVRVEVVNVAKIRKMSYLDIINNKWSTFYEV